MKKLTHILMAMLVITSFTSCEKIKELADIDFDVTYESSSIDVTPEATTAKTQGNYKFEAEEIIEFASNEDVKKYLDEIKDFEVESLVLYFENVSESFNVETLKFIMWNTKHSKEFTFLNQLIANNSELEISESDFSEIVSILENLEDFRFKWQGDGCDKNSNFKVKAKLKVKITANPLD